MSEKTPTIALILTRYREKRGFSQEELANTLNVSKDCIFALEAGNVTQYTLSEVKGVLKRFCYVCDLDWTRVLELCEKEYYARRHAEKKQHRAPQVWVTPRRMQWLIFGCLFIIGLGYVGVQLYGFVKQPDLELSADKPFQVISENIYTVEGSVNPEHTLLLNGERVTLSKGGTFSIDFRLRDGYNRLQFEVEKSNGQTQTKQVILYHS